MTFDSPLTHGFRKEHYDCSTADNKVTSNYDLNVGHPCKSWLIIKGVLSGTQPLSAHFLFWGYVLKNTKKTPKYLVVSK